MMKARTPRITFTGIVIIAAVFLGGCNQTSPGAPQKDQDVVQDRGPADDIAEDDQKSDDEMEQDAMNETEEQDVLTRVKEAENSQTTELEDVSGAAGSGTAYLLRKDDALYHAVVADLPNPPEGSFYEGWLVSADTPPRIISTGEMTKNPAGEYVLEFRSDTLYNGYNMVVITLEETRDEIPEEHILEGVVS